MAFLEGHFGLIGPNFKENLATEAVSLLAAAAVTETTTKRTEKEEGPSIGQKMASMGILMTTGIPISIGGSKKKVEKVKQTSELLFYLDVVAGPRRFRVDAQHFDYSCLGPKKQYSVMLNFKTLLSEIARLAPAARLNKGAQILQANRAIREMGYESLADLEKEEIAIISS